MQRPRQYICVVSKFHICQRRSGIVIAPSAFVSLYIQFVGPLTQQEPPLLTVVMQATLRLSNECFKFYLPLRKSVETPERLALCIVSERWERKPCHPVHERKVGGHITGRTIKGRTSIGADTDINFGMSATFRVASRRKWIGRRPYRLRVTCVIEDVRAPRRRR